MPSKVSKKLQPTIYNMRNFQQTISLSILLLSTIAVGYEALKISVSIPELVKLNEAFWLNCTHRKLPTSRVSNGVVDSEISSDLSVAKNLIAPEEIYAIKWYKDEEEFYRFLPKAEPKVSIYETNGIQLDQTKSFEGNVFLSKADVNSEGSYRCEILSEAPVFETVRKSKHLKVYAPPVRGPRIEILDSNGRPKSPKAQEISYAVGDKIELRCNSAPSKPAARLRWYLNEHEIAIPGSPSNLSSQNERQSRFSSAPTLGYDVKVTPIEYRPHYKGIYSSHSMLSLVLQQDDLINSKISFKCLASMRQDVPIQSKQLIVLTPQANPSSSLTNQQIARHTRQSHQSRTHQYQHHHHSKYSSTNNDLIGANNDDLERQLMYIYEESDSTFGPSIIDKPEYLKLYMRRLNETTYYTNENSVNLINNHNSVEFNRGDNMDYIQLLRDRMARQRSFPSSLQGNGNPTNGQYNLKRFHGANSLVKSPLYLDENDPLRPVINWPPLESGKLMLLPPGNIIVAIPTKAAASSDTKLVMPSRPSGSGGFITVDTSSSNKQSLRSRFSTFNEEFEENQTLRKILEKLVMNLNCSCNDGSIDTKLAWSVNEQPLSSRDTYFYPTKVSTDHRQSMLTVGLQALTGHQTSGSLQTILDKYYKDPDSSINRAPNSRREQMKSIPTNQLGQIDGQHIRFSCQATHSMLLHSSSEMITFDFNPPIDTNSIERLSSAASNVIQATSASQSRSSGQSNFGIVLESQTILTVFSMLTIKFICSHLM